MSSLVRKCSTTYRSQTRREFYRQLDRHLNANGIIIVVGGVTIGEPTYFYFDGWEGIFSNEFELVSKEICEDSRPYRVLVFARRDNAHRH